LLTLKAIHSYTLKFKVDVWGRCILEDPYFGEYEIDNPYLTDFQRQLIKYIQREKLQDQKEASKKFQKAISDRPAYQVGGG
jgi:hypothetical protein